MQGRDYWDALVRGWWLLAIFGLLGLAVGLLLPKSVSQGYWESTSSMGSPPTAGPTSSSIIGGGITPDQILYYAGTDQVMSWTSQLSGLNQPIWVIRNQVSLVGPPSNNSSSTAATSGQDGVVDVKVVASTPQEALALNTGFNEAMEFEVASVAQGSLTASEQQTEQILARVAYQSYTKSYPPGVSQAALDVQVARLQDSLANLITQLPNTGFQILRAPAAVSVTKASTGSAVNSRPIRAALGLGIGLLLGAVAAVVAWMLDRRLKTSKRAQLAFGYPVVAEIPDETSDATEPYRMLWLSVFHQPLPLPPAEQNEQLYQGEDPEIEPSARGASSTVGPPG